MGSDGSILVRACLGSVLGSDKKGMVLVVEVGHGEVGQAVAVGVAGIHSHPGFGKPILVVGDFGVHRDICKSAVVLVDEQQIRRCVARDKQICPAVVVQVDGNNTQGS